MSGPAAPKQSLQVLAFPALLLGGVSVGCAPILVRISEVGPSATAFWRVALALAPLALIALWAPRRSDVSATPRNTGEWLTVAAPGLFLGAELTIWHVSLHMTSVANATLLINLTPIFAALFGWAMFGRPVGRNFIVGVAIAVAGVTLVTLGGSSAGAGRLSGDAVALCGAVIYAGYFLTLGHARRRFSTASVMFASAASAALFTLPLALMEARLTPESAGGWMSLVALAWVVQAGGQGLVTFAIAWLPATLSSLAMLSQPFVAAAIAWALFDERLTALQMAGGLAVLGGILVARRG